MLVVLQLPGMGQALPPSTDVIRCLREVERGLSARLAEHEARVTRMARVLGEALGLEASHADALERAASLHDVGKLLVPEAVLGKSGPLTDEEREVMRSHAPLGFEILDAASDPELKLGALIARHHHEQWSGDGYPDALRGDAISPEARIVAICDVYDALREWRPYKGAMSHEEAMHRILAGDDRLSPTMFDPEVLRAFERSGDQMRATFER